MAARRSRPHRRPTSRPTSTTHEHKSCCGSSPAAASTTASRTLIGRLLYESHLVFEDHLAALEADSKKVGTQGGELDFALLVDGLAAEREQGITIDVAYRFFSTEQRKFIVADTPGHEQYTRNMVTGASTADARGDPDRRPQGRAHPDPPAQLPGVAARHPPRRRRRSTSSTSSTTRTRSSTQIEADYRAFAARDRPRPTSSASRCRRCAATTSPSRAPTPPGTTARR